MRRYLELVANAFPLWVLAACGLALAEPSFFAWFRGNAIVAALAVIMLKELILRAFRCDQRHTRTVMPAKAGIPLSVQHMLTQSGTPAFAAVTARLERKSSRDSIDRRSKSEGGGCS